MSIFKVFGRSKKDEVEILQADKKALTDMLDRHRDDLGKARSQHLQALALLADRDRSIKILNESLIRANERVMAIEKRVASYIDEMQAASVVISKVRTKKPRKKVAR